MNRAHIIPVILLISFCCSSVGYSQGTGLQFSGHEVPLDKRTGLNLTPDEPIEFASTVKLAFDLKFEPDRHSYFGYIFRVLLDEQNIDLIYTTIPIEGNNFHLVIGEKLSNITFSFPLEEITTRWVPVELTIDKNGGRIVLKLDGNEYVDQLVHSRGKSDLRIFFGAHNYNHFTSTDLPNMDIREIIFFEDGKKRYAWPLDQHEGNKVNESISNFNGTVDNPIWLLSYHKIWTLSNEIFFQGEIKYSFNEKTNKIHILQQDSLYQYDLSTKQLIPYAPANGFSPDDLFQLIYSSNKDQFVYYSLDKNVKCLLSNPAACRPVQQQFPAAPMHWHHNRIVNPGDDRLYTFGGYGQLTYKNDVFVYNDEAGKWDSVRYKGIFFPRYLAGMGYNPKNHKVYLLGGYGSRQGKQTINPGYYYDLLTYSFDENRFETLADFSEGNQDFCFSNSLYIDTASNILYGLKFSKYEATPEVQAIAISLDDYTLKEVGNTFSFPFLDISSTLDLYYDRHNEQLVSINTFYENEETRVTIHQIAFPPITDLPANEIRQKSYIPEILFGVIILIAAILVILIWTRKKRTKQEVVPFSADSYLEDNGNYLAKHFDSSLKPGSIIVFGGFQIIDAKGKDITSAFTPLLKGLFLYIMISSVRHNKGVSSKSIDEVFWLDKSKQSARNNRSVNILKLKTLLQNVGECEISKETGYWKFTFDPASIYLDFYEYQQIIRKGKLNTKEDMYDLLKIIHRGPALQNINADWLDDIKSELSNEIIDNILEFLQNKEKKIDPEFAIQLTNCVFFFDMINEEAMSYKCKLLVSLGKHSLAKNAYERFVKEYKTLYDEDYDKSFAEILKS